MSDACTCGHSVEEHGGDEDYPGDKSCHGDYDGDPCRCIHYERELEEDSDDHPA